MQLALQKFFEKKQVQAIMQLAMQYPCGTKYASTASQPISALDRVYRTPIADRTVAVRRWFEAMLPVLLTADGCSPGSGNGTF